MHSVANDHGASSPCPLPYVAHKGASPNLDRVPSMNSASIRRPRVLCFGQDTVLGETRRAVFEHRYDAVFVGSLEQLAFLAAGAPFDVIVLCHTLSLEQRLSCLELARDVWPQAGVVSVATRSTHGQTEFGSVVLGLDGPAALLNCIQQVLQLVRPGIGLS